MSGNISMSYMLKTAFDYEIRNYVDIKLFELNSLEENDEKELDEIRLLQHVKEYMLKRIGEMKT